MSSKQFLGVAAALAIAGVALAANTKIKVFTAAGTGTALNANVDGMAIFKDRTDPVFGPGSELHLHMQDLQPGTTYNIAVFPTGSADPDAYNGLDTFTTNASGNATIELFLTGWGRALLGPNPRVQVYVFDGDAENLNVISSSELRAEGTAN